MRLLITDIIDAVYEVVFFSSNPNPSDKSFSFTIGDANFLPSTGHYYVYFEQTGITWIQAQQAAENSNYYGLQGYLVTILSDEENQISAEQQRALVGLVLVIKELKVDGIGLLVQRV